LDFSTNFLKKSFYTKHSRKLIGCYFDLWRNWLPFNKIYHEIEMTKKALA